MIIGVGDILKILCSDGVIRICKAGWSHFGYVIHYKKNIQKLEDEIVGLDDEWRRIDGSAHRARDDAGVVENDVWKWLTSANGMKAEVEVFLLDMVRANKSCFKCSCPNICWRYWLGKESKRKTACVIILKEEGAKFMTCPVAHRAPLPDAGFTFSANYEAFDSRKHIFEEIIRSLKDPSIKMIGIYGPGGVGKTTMVEEVRQLAKRKGLFHSVAMTTVSKVVEKEKVQGELASQLGLQLDEYGRAGQLLNRLRNGQRTLVILDDVWEPLDLADIGIPTTDGGNNEPLNLPDIGIAFTTGSDMGCKVVIATRKQRVCQMMQKSSELKNFPIGVLTKTEAWRLFRKVAEISVDSEIPSEAKEVCEKCGGLPVAICAVAAALKDKGMHAWKDALRQLKNYKIKEIADIDPKLFISLKWSYDRLEPKDARSCFLLCSLFPEDAEISINKLVSYSVGMRLLDENLNIVDEVRNRVLAMVDVLKTSCLLLDGKHRSVVKLHDIIRDVAISIAKDEKRYLVKHGIEKWPEKGRYEHYSAISLRFTTNIHEFPNELECRGLHTLVLKCSNRSLTDFPNNFFNGMENNLEVLDLSEMPIKSLPSSLLTLVKLRMLCLNGGRLMTDIALLGSLRNLEILSLSGMKKVLFHDEGVTGFSELQFLKSQGQIPSGFFGNLCELYVADCQFKFLFTTSIARGLERLQHLQITRCTDMEEIIRNERQGDDEEIIFHHLKKMVLEALPNLRSFYSSMKNTSTTEANNFNPSPPLFCEKVAFPALEYLEIRHVQNISGIIEVKQLKLPVQQQANESFWQLRNLPRLRHLYIQYCLDLKAIVVVNKKRVPHNKPLIFRELCSLVLFNLSNLKSFYGIYGSEVEDEKEVSEPQPLFNEKVVFPCLKELVIHRLNNFKQIWISTPPTNSFNKLASLSVRWCTKLLYVAPLELLGSLQNLQSLEIKSCGSIEEIFKTKELNAGEGIISRDEVTSEQVEIIPVPLQLERVSLEKSPRLISFCSGYKLPPSVQLSIQECRSFRLLM